MLYGHISGYHYSSAYVDLLIYLQQLRIRVKNSDVYTCISYLSKSVSLDESRKPLAKGLLSIFSFVI